MSANPGLRQRDRISRLLQPVCSSDGLDGLTMLTLLLPAAGHELFKVAKELLPGRCLQLVHAERTLASGASAGFVPVVTEPAQTGKEIEALFCAWTSSFSRSSSDPHWSA